MQKCAAYTRRHTVSTNNNFKNCVHLHKSTMNPSDHNSDNQAFRTRGPLWGILLVSTIACIVAIIFIFHFYIPSAQKDERTPTVHHRQQIGHRHEIGGVSFNAVTEGRQRISLQADRLYIENKKIGFFRCGLIHKATLENAIIHIYGNRGTENRAHGSGADDRTLTFRDAFSRDGLPSFQTKKIASIVMKPVSVELHDEKTSVTSISADSAEIDFDRRCILFQGAVRMASGNKTLATSRLNLFTDPTEIRCERHFTLTTPERRLEGERLIADIFLRPAFSDTKS